MDGKKISFGFLKTKKVEKPVVEEKKEFIECMEEKAIKVVGGEQIKEEAPLIIPMKPNTLVTAERLKQIAEEVESVLDEPEPEIKKSPKSENITENETLDQMVVRELLQEAKKEVKLETEELTVPIPAKPIFQGTKESTLEDYEVVPVQQFGMAMLRGMGWSPSKETSKYKQPQLRPKGLGLGADKVVSEKKKTPVNEKGEELIITKNSYVKITTGKYSGYYGKVLSLDEDNGRVMVDIAVKKETVSLSEFMMQAVTKTEYDKESKVINADSFDEYKRAEMKSEKMSKRDPPKADREATSSRKDTKNGDKNDDRISRKNVDEVKDGRGRDKYRRDSSGSEERSRKPRKEKKKRYSSSDSMSSLSDADRKRHKSSKKRYSSTDSDSDSPKREKRKKTSEKKRDIDKKRKGKKKKRDRDRSPNYKKHRK
ncbi:unnamed protein product [Diatraea saccharalis]|uniref:KOW domain-containing protein n=1 Tax=Diatraea saccharalis TaxID=40085 RepID=A0A9N9R7Q2_9NEOP|nr:unnamed protein product [Diatraea saccharalis]